MPTGDISYKNRVARKGGLTMINYKLANPVTIVAPTTDITYFKKADERRAAPINIVNNVVDDFVDERLNA